jgi:endonuclease YncB( thermonuclease family)
MNFRRAIRGFMAAAFLLLPGPLAAEQEFQIDLNFELQKLRESRKPPEADPQNPAAPGISRSEDALPIDVARGDILTIAGMRYRLWGIAAPQPNEYGGYTSAQFLRQLLAGASVSCLTTGQIIDRMPLARCRIDGKDIAEILVAGGYARDCPRQSRGNYAALERRAVYNVAGGFELPPECLEE